MYYLPLENKDGVTPQNKQKQHIIISIIIFSITCEQPTGKTEWVHHVVDDYDQN